MNAQHVVIVSPCTFTRVALGNHLEKKGGMTIHLLAAAASASWAVRAIALLYPVRLWVIHVTPTLSNGELHCLDEGVRQAPLGCQVLVLVDSVCSAMLTRLPHIGQRALAIVDSAVTLPQLDDYLQGGAPAGNVSGAVPAARSPHVRGVHHQQRGEGGAGTLKKRAPDVIGLCAVKKILVVHDCAFTRLGLQALLAGKGDVLTFDQLQAGQEHLRVCGHVDMLILSLECVTLENRHALSVLSRLLRRQHSQCCVLLVSNAANIPRLRFMMCQLPDRTGQVDLGGSLSDLMDWFGGVLAGQVALISPALPDRLRLTDRENTVLNALLAGVKTANVAKALGLHCKTVSHYKRHGLYKLGARNLQTLLSTSATDLAGIDNSAMFE